MRISLDIDGLLTAPAAAFPLEGQRWPTFVHRFAEPLRQGTPRLITELKKRRVDVWIYTTSTRGALYIRFWLLLYGIRVAGVINDARHRQALAGQTFARQPSKYPPAFGIDLHVDDSLGVLQEGDELGFPVLVVREDDACWVETILAAVDSL